MTAAVLAACSGDEFINGQAEADAVSLKLDVKENDWRGETVEVTRSGETLEGLRTSTSGFGLYCSNPLNYTNAQVTWDGSLWRIGSGYYTYWERSKTGTVPVYAYAPYMAEPTVNGSSLTFTAQNLGYPGYTDKLSGDNADLLYANTTYDLNNTDPAMLTFNHALAKMTFGTVTNNSGQTLSLKGFTVTGTFNTQADLNLATGVWSNHTTTADDYEISFPPAFVTVVSYASEIPAEPDHPYAVIEPLLDKQTALPNMPNRSLLLIPNADGKIEVTVGVKSNVANENFSFPVTLEQGEDKTYNITIGKNFEVELTNY